MNRLQVVVIQQSWETVRAIGPEAGALFHYHLLHAAPALRPRLRGGIDACARQWLSTVSAVVGNLHHLDRLAPQLQEYIERHAEHGMDSRLLLAARDSLLMTLEYCLGDAWSWEVEEAWLDACELVTELTPATFGELVPRSSAPTSAAA